MTQDEIIKMAIENTINGLAFNQDGLVRFAKLVAQHEREACAKVCDAVTQDMSLGPLEKYRASWLANEIRARGQA